MAPIVWLLRLLVLLVPLVPLVLLVLLALLALLVPPARLMLPALRQRGRPAAPRARTTALGPRRLVSRR